MPAARRAPKEERRLILQVVQPGLLGLMDGSVSTLAPLFATAAMTGKPHDAFVVGLAASLGAGISMGLAEALSDDGEIRSRKPAHQRKRDRSWNGDRRDVRFWFMRTPLGRTIVQVIGGGAIVFAVGLLLGRFGAGD